MANKFGISTQVPRKQEIVSNNISAKVKEVTIGKAAFIVRRPTVAATNDNVLVLQMLEMLKYVDSYMDYDYDEAGEHFKDYIERYRIRKMDVYRYIREFPLAIFKNYYEMGLDHVLA